MILLFTLGAASQPDIETQFYAERKKIRELPPMSFSDVQKYADALDAAWKDREAKYYGEITLAMIQVVRTVVGDPVDLHTATIEHMVLGERVARRALNNRKDIPIYLQVQLADAITVHPCFLAGESPTPAEKDADLQQKASLVLSILTDFEAAIDRKYDPNNPANHPWRNLPLPKGVSVRPDGTPGEIKDPVLRAQYEAAVAENRKKAEKLRLQDELRTLDEDFVPWCEKLLVDLYKGRPDAAKELGALFEKSHTPQKYSEKILQMLEEAKKTNGQSK
jgi:DnaJ-domain-containing protein 1